MRLLAFALSFGCALAAHAGTSGLDLGFGTGGVVLIGNSPVSAVNVQFRAAVIQGDGKIALSGRSFNLFPNNAVVARLNADGTWDTGFGANGLVTFYYPNATNAACFDRVRLFSDGSLLAAGGAGICHFTGSTPTCTLLAKVDGTGAAVTTFGSTGDGTLCFDFAPDTGAGGGHYQDIAIDTDDTFYLTALQTNLSHGAVAHFDDTGALITSYGANGQAALADNVFANLLQIRPDHSMLATAIGVADGATNTENVSSAALTVSGAADMSYGSAGLFAFDQAPSTFTGPTFAALDANGNLVIADNDAENSSGTSFLPYRIARITPAGAFDVQFNGHGQQPGYPGFASLTALVNTNMDYLVAAQPLPDGHILGVGVVGGTTPSDGTTNIALLRLDNDATFDSSFGDASHPGWLSLNLGGLPASIGYAWSTTMDSAGRLYIVASVSDSLGQNCSAILRVIPDRLFADTLEAAPTFPTCP